MVFHTVPGLRNEALFRIGGECGECESGSKPNRNISEILMKSGWSISDFSGWFRGTFFNPDEIDQEYFRNPNEIWLVDFRFF